MNNLQIVQQYVSEIKGNGIAYKVSKPVHTFHFSVPEVAPWTYTVTKTNYIHPLAELIYRINPKVYGVIGVLAGTMESSLLQLYTNLNLQKIVICDIDLADFVPGRDMGSYAYRNICGTNYGNFQGEFIYIRADSTKTKSIDTLGPYDLFFVDGQHEKTAVYKDMETAWRNLTPNGVILVHDIDLTSSSVREGYDNWIQQHEKEIDHIEISNDKFFLGLGIVVKKF